MIQRARMADMMGWLSASVLIAGAIAWRAPEWWLALCRPFMTLVIEQATPWLSSVSMQIEGTTLLIEGRLELGVTQIDGQPVPGLKAQWSRSGNKYMIPMLVAFVTWAIPPLSWRKRLCILPLTLLMAALIGAGTLTNELKYAGLREMGGGALIQIELENTQANVERLQAFENQLKRVTWVKAFNDAGGNLFLAVLAGLMGYAVPRIPSPLPGQRHLPRPARGPRK